MHGYSGVIEIKEKDSPVVGRVIKADHLTSNVFFNKHDREIHSAQRLTQAMDRMISAAAAFTKKAEEV